ncbi:MAG TPA: TraB/GumN family protein [Rhizomicrobium sp.]
MKRLAFALFLMLPAAATAQNAPVQDWSNIETVTVIAPKPGPALWHIVQNGSDVWILATVSPMPKDLQWNSAALEDIISGANHVYLAPQLTAGLLETSWFLLTGLHKIKLPDDQTLQTTLPPDLQARRAAWLAKIKADADTDERYQPAMAAVDLEAMFRNRTGLDGEEADSRIEKLADKADVEAKPLATYEMMPIVDEIPSLNAQSENICMKDALDDIDTQAAHADAAARAWAVGDLAGVKANYSDTRLYDCFAQTQSFASDRERAIVKTLSAVHASLAKPGKSLILVGIGVLLQKDGVLDRLKTQGITVEGPPD